MTTIRVTCPQCGAIDLTPGDIELRVVESDGPGIGSDSHYTFTCTSCGVRVAKPADEKVADILKSGGVVTEVVAPTATPDPHPESPPGGPQLTYDDLIDLHNLLETDDWFGQLLELTH